MERRKNTKDASDVGIVVPENSHPFPDPTISEPKAYITIILRVHFGVYIPYRSLDLIQTTQRVFIASLLEKRGQTLVLADGVLSL